MSSSNIGTTTGAATGKPGAGAGAGETRDLPDPALATTPKRQVLRKKRRTHAWLEQVWAGAQLATVVFGAVYMAYYLTLRKQRLIPRILYRLVFVGVLTAYGTSLYHAFGTNVPSGYALLAQELFQYLLWAGVCLITNNSLFKVLPFIIISVLQIGSHFHIAPVELASPQLARVVAYNELVVLGYLLLRTLCFRLTSGFQFVLYVSFYWLRVLYSPPTHALFQYLVLKADAHVAGVKNDKVQKYWGKFKVFLDAKKEQLERATATE